eukprot:5001507-Prymnesium_polylepis.2
MAVEDNDVPSPQHTVFQQRRQHAIEVARRVVAQLQSDVQRRANGMAVIWRAAAHDGRRE